MFAIVPQFLFYSLSLLGFGDCGKDETGLDRTIGRGRGRGLSKSWSWG